MLRASVEGDALRLRFGAGLGLRCSQAYIRAIKNRVSDHRQHLWCGLSASQFRALNRQRRG